MNKLSLRNDVGLLAEQYDPIDKRQLGNFPQAFSHVAMVNSAFGLSNASRSSAYIRRIPSTGCGISRSSQP